MTINVSKIMKIIEQVTAIALMLISAVTIAQAYGITIPRVPTMPPVNLLYFTAAWAFLTGKIKFG